MLEIHPFEYGYETIFNDWKYLFKRKNIDNNVMKRLTTIFQKRYSEEYEELEYFF